MVGRGGKGRGLNGSERGGGEPAQFTGEKAVLFNGEKDPEGRREVKIRLSQLLQGEKEERLEGGEGFLQKKKDGRS